MKTLPAVLVLMAGSLMAAGAAAALHPERPQWRAPAVATITAQQALALNAVVWVDARTAAAFARGHAPGAIHLTERAWDDGLERLLAVWAPPARLVVYCDSGGCRTAEQVAARLERELQVNVQVVAGGWASVAAALGVAP